MPAEATVLIITALLKYGPSLAREIHALFTVESPTKEQWEKVFITAEKSYDDYVRGN
jgi:hypothetical protein